MRQWLKARLATLALGLVTTLVVVSATVGGAVIGAGSLATTSPTNCSATPTPREATVSAASITIRVVYDAAEDNTRQDRWTGGITVAWAAWPTDVLGNGASPGDKGASTNTQPDGSGDTWLPDTPSFTDTYHQVPGPSWSASNFELAGDYRATATISMTNQDKGWDDPDSAWASRCTSSADAEILIHWTPGNGGDEVVIIL